MVDEKVKTLKYRVNTGTWLCATHANERCPPLYRAVYNPFTGKRISINILCYCNKNPRAIDQKSVQRRYSEPRHRGAVDSVTSTQREQPANTLKQLRLRRRQGSGTENDGESPHSLQHLFFAKHA
jgi:hypothetical protein